MGRAGEARARPWSAEEGAGSSILRLGGTQRGGHDLLAGARDSGLETHEPCALLRASSSLQPRAPWGWVTKRLLGSGPVPRALGHPLRWACCEPRRHRRKPRLGAEAHSLWVRGQGSDAGSPTPKAGYWVLGPQWRLTSERQQCWVQRKMGSDPKAVPQAARSTGPSSLSLQTCSANCVLQPVLRGGRGVRRGHCLGDSHSGAAAKARF